MPSRKRPRHLREEPAAFGRGPELREVAFSEAKTHLSGLLDEVERGATIVITRHGRPIARIVPESERRQEEIDEALADIERLAKEIRERHGETTVEEILSSIHEGHKY